MVTRFRWIGIWCNRTGWNEGRFGCKCFYGTLVWISRLILVDSYLIWWRFNRNDSIIHSRLLLKQDWRRNPRDSPQILTQFERFPSKISWIIWGLRWIESSVWALVYFSVEFIVYFFLEGRGGIFDFLWTFWNRCSNLFQLEVKRSFFFMDSLVNYSYCKTQKWRKGFGLPATGDWHRWLHFSDLQRIEFRPYHLRRVARFRSVEWSLLHCRKLERTQKKNRIAFVTAINGR